MRARLALALVLAAVGAALTPCATPLRERRVTGLAPQAQVPPPGLAAGELEPAPPGEDAPAAAPGRREAAAAPAAQEEPPFAEADPPRPEDPLELGACALELHLVDAVSGAPVAGAVQLWRLRAPESTGWSAGDQLQASAQVPVEGWTFVALPAGEYRLVNLADVPEAPDPPALWVTGALSVHSAYVHPARERVVHLELRDLAGVRLERIDVRRGSRWATQREPERPAWLTARRAKRAGSGHGGGGGSYGGSSHRPWRTLTAGPRGFELGEVEESDRDTERRQAFRLRDASGAEVELVVGPLPAEGGRLLATFVGEEDALTSVRLPGGGDARGWEGMRRVKLHPVVADDAHPGADFGDTRVEVGLHRADASPLKIEWRLGRGFAPVLLDVEDLEGTSSVRPAR